MRTALVNLPWFAGDRRGVRAGSRWPFTSAPGPDGRLEYVPFPFFLAYSASLLAKNGLEARVFDAVAEGWSENDFLRLIQAYAPGLAVIETSAPSFANDVRLIRQLRAALPECRIAFCGPHATALPAGILDELACVDYVFIGEYEFTALRAAQRLARGLEPLPGPGMGMRVNGRAMIGASVTVPDMDALPWPSRRGLPMGRYCDGFCGLPKPNLQVMSSRGCPFRCSFCLWPQTIYSGAGFRNRRAEDVIAEISAELPQGPYRSVYFDDDLVNLDRGHLALLCKGMAGFKLPWGAMGRPDLMDEPMLDLLASAGLYAIKYGIESADSGILEACGKKMDPAKALRAVRMTRERGIRVHLAFCLGLPGETPETAAKTLEFIREAKPDSLQVSYATPFPGTQLYKRAKADGTLSSSDLSWYDGNRQLVSGTGLSEEQARSFRERMLKRE